MQKRNASKQISLKQDVREYLSMLGKELRRDRNFLLNAIVREFASRHGVSPRPPTPDEAIIEM